MSYIDPTDAPISASTPGVVHSMGRGQVITPQSLILMQGRARSDEKNRRKRLAAGRTKLLAPPTDSEAAFNIFKGQLCFCILDHGMTFRGHPGTDAAAHVEVVANMAGFPASDLNRLGMPAVIQVSREVGTSPGSDERTTIVVRGTQTIVHTGLDPIRVGQMVIADPFAPTTTVNGQEVPAVEIEGVARGFAAPGLRGLDSDTVYAMVAKYKEWLRLKLADPAIANAKDDQALGKELLKLVKAVRIDDKLAEHMPVVGYLSVWVTWFYMKLMMMDGKIKRMAMAMQALQRRLCEVETEFSNIARDFDASLPHNSNLKNGYGQKPSERSVKQLTHAMHPNAINDLFRVDKKAGTLGLLKLAARLDLFAHENLEIFLHEQVAWLKRFKVGVALSSTTKAMPLDIAMGSA